MVGFVGVVVCGECCCVSGGDGYGGLVLVGGGGLFGFCGGVDVCFGSGGFGFGGVGGGDCVMLVGEDYLGFGDVDLVGEYMIVFCCVCLVLECGGVCILVGDDFV